MIIDNSRQSLPGTVFPNIPIIKIWWDEEREVETWKCQNVPRYQELQHPGYYNGNQPVLCYSIGLCHPGYFEYIVDGFRKRVHFWHNNWEFAVNRQVNCQPFNQPFLIQSFFTFEQCKTLHKEVRGNNDAEATAFCLPNQG